MKKVLVTVGTTSFDSLFECLDRCVIPSNWVLECQIAKGEYRPKRGTWFSFDSTFDKKLLDADIVITHAGAGTVYQLLELGKNCIVVANLERKDQHQKELTQFVRDNKYALGVALLADLQAAIDALADFKPAIYTKTPFFFADKLQQHIDSLYAPVDEK